MKVKLLVIMLSQLALGLGLTSCEKKAQDTVVSLNQMIDDSDNYRKEIERICNQTPPNKIRYIKGNLLPIMHSGIMLRLDAAKGGDLEVNFGCFDETTSQKYQNLVHSSLYSSDLIKYDGRAIFVLWNTTTKQVCQTDDPIDQCYTSKEVLLIDPIAE